MKFKNSVCYIILLLIVISCSYVNEKNTLKSKSIFELLNGDTLINQEVKLSGYIALDSLSTELIYIDPYQIDAENEFVARAIALEGLNKKLLKSCLNSYVHIQATFVSNGMDSSST